MRIILRQDIQDLGMEGDIVEVARGYARNFLIPKGFALEATPQNLKAFEAQKKKVEVRRLKAKEEAEALGRRLEEITLRFRQKAGGEGRLYGSVTSMDIAEQLAEKGIVVDRRKVVLDKPIKSTGEFEVAIKIHPEVSAKVAVYVEAEEASS